LYETGVGGTGSVSGIRLIKNLFISRSWYKGSRLHSKIETRRSNAIIIPKNGRYYYERSGISLAGGHFNILKAN